MFLGFLLHCSGRDIAGLLLNMWVANSNPIWACGVPWWTSQDPTNQVAVHQPAPEVCDEMWTHPSFVRSMMAVIVLISL